MCARSITLLFLLAGLSEAVQTAPPRDAWVPGKYIAPDIFSVDRLPDATIVIGIH
jgi:hypothetical protein